MYFGFESIVFFRYSPKGLPDAPTCGHRGKKNCSLLTMQDINRFHSAFYSVKSKASQDAFILKYCSVEQPKRTRPGDGSRSAKGVSYQYCIETTAGNKLEVCRNSFINVLGITKHRVEGVFTRFKKDGCLIPVETRGGYRKAETYGKKIDAVIEFVKQFKGTESHYSRARSTRIYLDSSLSISKMWNMYEESVVDELKVKESFFRHIFVTRFNISFKSPSTDVCSTCLQYREKIKVEKNEEILQKLKTEYDVHKTLAKGFFNLLKKEEPNVAVMSYDMQKNLPLPKLPDQSTYYSRQLYCYNLTIVSGCSTGTEALRKENVSIYSWAEHEMKKSSNEIASAVFEELECRSKSGYFEGKDTLRLVADGCPGQNKNTIVLTMCIAWLQRTKTSITKVELVFPVTGHSYMPSDRVFGGIERSIKKIDTIVQLEEYHSEFSKHGTVKLLGKDWTNQDWKSETKNCVKDPKNLHFKISQVKKLILTKKQKSVTVSGEQNYSFEINSSLSVMRPGKKVWDINPAELTLGVKVNALKIKDVRDLLQKHYGEKWSEMENVKWYNEVINNNEMMPENPLPECECLNNNACDEVMEVNQVVADV